MTWRLSVLVCISVMTVDMSIAFACACQLFTKAKAALCHHSCKLRQARTLESRGQGLCPCAISTAEVPDSLSDSGCQGLHLRNRGSDPCAAHVSSWRNGSPCFRICLILLLILRGSNVRTEPFIIPLDSQWRPPPRKSQGGGMCF